MFKNFIHSK